MSDVKRLMLIEGEEGIDVRMVDRQTLYKECKPANPFFQQSQPKFVKLEVLQFGATFEYQGDEYRKLKSLPNGEVEVRRTGAGRPPKNPLTLPGWAWVKY